MPGMIYRVIPRQEYDFGALANNSATVKVLVAKGIDVSAFREAVLQVRLHAKNITSGVNPSVTISVSTDAPTTEDPSRDFTDGTVLATKTISGTDDPGTLYLDDLTAPFGSHVRIYVQPTQPPAPPLATTFKMTISADIVAKS